MTWEWSVLIIVLTLSATVMWLDYMDRRDKKREQRPQEALENDIKELKGQIEIQAKYVEDVKKLLTQQQLAQSLRGQR